MMPRAFVLCLKPPTPARNEDGLAVMWDGQDSAPEATNEVQSPSETQSELLSALAAGEWPTDRPRLHAMLEHMGFALQMDMFDRESWVKGDGRDMRRAVIRTYPETGKLEFTTNVALDEVLVKKRKGPPFKGMEQAFDRALGHARSLLGAPAHESATTEPGTSSAPMALRLAQWKKGPVRVSLLLEHKGPDFALAIDWLIEPDVPAEIVAPRKGAAS